MSQTEINKNEKKEQELNANLEKKNSEENMLLLPSSLPKVPITAFRLKPKTDEEPTEPTEKKSATKLEDQDKVPRTYELPKMPSLSFLRRKESATKLENQPEKPDAKAAEEQRKRQQAAEDAKRRQERSEQIRKRRAQLDKLQRPDLLEKFRNRNAGPNLKRPKRCLRENCSSQSLVKRRKIPNRPMNRKCCCNCCHCCSHCNNCKKQSGLGASRYGCGENRIGWQNLRKDYLTYLPLKSKKRNDRDPMSMCDDYLHNIFDDCSSDSYFSDF